MKEEKKNEEAEPAPEKRSLSFQAIRAVLWDEIHDVQNGDANAANLTAITNASGKILSAVALEVKLCQLTGGKPSSDIISLLAPAVKSITD